MNIQNISRKKLTQSWFISIALLIITITFLVFPVGVIANDAPVLVSPADNATDIAVTDITFTWQSYDAFTVAYSFQLSTDSSFSTTVTPSDLTISDNQTSYVYTGTLDYSTKYYWRVQAWDPNLSEWAVANFTTVASGGTPADTSSTTDGTEGTAPTGGEGSFIDTAIDFLEEIGWPLVGGMAFVLIVLIVLIVMLLTKPKKKAPPRMGGVPMGAGMGPGMGPGMGQQVQCQACGTMNIAGRKFCSNCGGNLMAAGQQFQQRPPQYSPGGSICQNCGSPIPPGRQFCSVCGNKVMPTQQADWQSTQFKQSNNCTVCGSLLQPGQQFCANCGSRVSAGQQQTSTTYQTEAFMCPICGASINRGTNPCPGCNTWLDWGM